MPTASKIWIFGSLACIVCLVFTLRCAFTFAKKEPIIFLALNIYAAQWGILIVFYNSIDWKEISPREPILLPEFLPALSGYMCCIVGSMVYRNKRKADGKLSRSTLPREGVFAWLLLTLALPEALDLFRAILPQTIGHDDVEVFVTLLLKTLGFYSLYRSLEVGQRHKYLFCFVALTLLAYECLEAGYTAMWLYNKHYAPVRATTMTSFFLCAFGSVKLLTAFTYIPAVLSDYKPFNRLSFIQRFLYFVHIEGD